MRPPALPRAAEKRKSIGRRRQGILVLERHSRAAILHAASAASNPAAPLTGSAITHPRSRRCFKYSRFVSPAPHRWRRAGQRIFIPAQRSIGSAIAGSAPHKFLSRFASPIHLLFPVSAFDPVPVAEALSKSIVLSL